MKVSVFAFFALVTTLASCGAAGNRHAADASAAVDAEDAGHAASTDEARLHERLATAIAPLVQPPFGTAAAASAALGSTRTTAAIGTTHAGGHAVGTGTVFNVASVSKALTAAR